MKKHTLKFPLKFDKCVDDDILIESDRVGTFVSRKSPASQFWCLDDWSLRRLVALANESLARKEEAPCRK